MLCLCIRNIFWCAGHLRPRWWLTIMRLICLWKWPRWRYKFSFWSTGKYSHVPNWSYITCDLDGELFAYGWHGGTVFFTYMQVHFDSYEGLPTTYYLYASGIKSYVYLIALKNNKALYAVGMEKDQIWRISSWMQTRHLRNPNS